MIQYTKLCFLANNLGSKWHTHCGISCSFAPTETFSSLATVRLAPDLEPRHKGTAVGKNTQLN
uniref:Uncharacterized protein n=1 Tax=Arundo donax TaxID=35708 RepID=A0A0A9DJP9_ARUDO